MRVSGRSLTALALAAATLSAASSAEAAPGALGPPLQVCTTGEQGCLSKGGGGDTTVSPNIVHVGDVFTVTLTPNDGYGGIASYGDPAPPVPATKLGCTGGKIVKVKVDDAHKYDAETMMSGPRVCRFKATGATDGWVDVRVGFSVRYGGLSSYSDDALAIVPKGVYYVQGYVRTPPYPGSPPKGLGISGMKVGVFSSAKKGAGGYEFSKKVTTDNNGYYEVQVSKTGTYDVIGYLRDSDRKVHPMPHVSPSQAHAVVTETSTKETNLTLSRKTSLTLSIEDPKGRDLTTVRADGAGHGVAVVKVSEPNDNPVVGQHLTVEVNQQAGTGTPRAKVCDSGGTRVWPDADYGPDVRDYNMTTDQSGEKRFDVFFGTEPGDFELSASLTSQPGLVDTAHVSVAAQHGAALTPVSLTRTLWSAIATPLSSGAFRLDANAPMVSNGISQASPGASTDAPGNISKYLVSIAGRLQGIAFTPITSKPGDAGAATGVAFYPAGSVVGRRDGTLDLPASALVLPDEDQNGLGALFQLDVKTTLGLGTQVMGYTPVAIPTIGAWKAKHHVQAVYGGGFGIPPAIYGGGPEPVGDIATSTCLNG